MKRPLAANKTNQTAMFLVIALLSGCTVGPDYKKPASGAPQDWTQWRSGESSLQTQSGQGSVADSEWWKQYHDQVLDELVRRALTSNPDIRTAALRFYSARVQTQVTASSATPEIDATGSVTRVQTSKNSPSTLALRQVLPESDQLLSLMTKPYNWYQTGLDFSWELDLWGHVRRAIEASNADLTAQKALLGLARLSIIGDVVSNYNNLRAVQQQMRLAEQDVSTMASRLELISARNQNGALNYTDVDRQQTELAGTRATLVDLRQQEGVAMNRIVLLTGDHPGALNQLLVAPEQIQTSLMLPALSLGVPSEVALNRPDIQAAEAQLHAATARIGVARAELYPSVTLGAQIGTDSYSSRAVSDWESRNWSIGPSLNLPLFDRGRRKATVVLREVDQQQAAINYHKTVLQAWQEIDDALSQYAAAQQKLVEQQQRVNSAEQVLNLTEARYRGGLISFIDVLDSQRTATQSRQALIISIRDEKNAWAAVNRAIGNYPH